MAPIETNTKLIRPIPSRRRCFTPERAGRTLVLVKRIVADLVREHHRAEELHERLEAAQSAGLSALAADAREELLQAAEAIRRCLAEMEEVGAEVEDPRMGVVDYPARAGRREIRLCWLWGEPRVAHWHEMDETAAQRKPMDSL